MINIQALNKSLIEIKLRQNVYTCKVAISKAFLEEWDDAAFLLAQRHTGKFAELPHKVIEETDAGYIYELDIDAGSNPFFQSEEVIDLSIVRTRGEEEKRSRIKSNYEYIELLQIPMENGRMIHPFTTREGNISFNIREDYLFARVDFAEVSQTGLFHLYGFFHHPDVAVESIKKMELVATTTLNEEEPVHFPLYSQEIPDSFEKYPWYSAVRKSGFSGSVDLKPFMTIGEDNYFKFYLRLEYERDGHIEETLSGRLKINPSRSKFPIRKKYQHESGKILITCRPTRKSKYLSLRLSEYRFVLESARTAKRKWVEVRRSKPVLEAYKSAFYTLGKTRKRDRKLAIFESFHGKQFSDSPRAIYEYMQEHHKEYKLVWSADRRHVSYFQEKGIPHVRRFSARWLLLMTRAKFWVTNARLPLWIPKPEDTVYLQTWHGTPLKRLAADMEEVHMPGTDTAKYKENFTAEAAKWDYLVSPNAYSTKIFRRAFQFDREMIESGYPRNDYLYQHNNPQSISRIKQDLGIAQDKKVILYAPTWRDNQFYRRGKYKFDLELDLEKLREAFGKTHVILLRMHYLVAENLDISEYEGFVYDCSGYEDIRDLYLISDYLITDYSSVFFDYANLRRPMLFFVYDIDDYRDNLRGFYFDFESKAPGPLTKSTAGLIKEISKIEKEGFRPTETYDAFIERFCYLEDGNASKRVVDQVFKP